MCRAGMVTTLSLLAILRDVRLLHGKERACDLVSRALRVRWSGGLSSPLLLGVMHVLCCEYAGDALPWTA